MEIFEITRQEPQTHSFRTDNVLMNELGLGVFTTGILYEYFNERSSDGFYSNRGGLRNPIMISSAKDLLGDTAEWYGFRKTQYTGQYLPYSIRQWDLAEFNQAKPYDFSMIPFDQFSPDPTKGTVDSVEVLNGEFPVKKYSPFYVPTSRSKGAVSQEKYPELYRQELEKRAVEDANFLVGSDIMNVISMNNFMIDLKRTLPRSEWSELDAGIFNKDSLFAMDEYLIDIKTSKSNGMYGSGEVTFFVQMAGGQFECEITEWVSWELMLRDNPPQNREDNKAKAIISNQLVADYKRDETQRSYRKNTDGEIVTPDTTANNQKTVAPMSMNYNAYKNEWESGTTSIMAIVSGDIPAAPFAPNLEKLATGDIQDILNSANEKDKVTFGSGIAMPVFMQNSNPYHWAPNYAKEAGCRGSDNQKQVVKVHNFNPKKSYKQGDTVILTEIGGIWHVMDPGIGDAEPPAPVAKGKWEFSYHMTNFEYFFKGYVTPENNIDERPFSYTPSIAERYFHRRYYIDDVKNNSDSQGPGVNYNDQFSTKNLDVYYFPDGTWQTTSFDFMDSKLLGLRGAGGIVDKNALNTTQATKDAAGRAIPLGNRERNAAHSGPFYGCVFPDGYVVDADLIAEERDYNIIYHNSGAKDNDVNSLDQSVAAYPGGTVGDVGSRYFLTYANTQNNNTVESHPFIDPPETSEIQQTSYPLGVRSDPRSAVNVAGDEPFDDREVWQRFSNKQGPSMFGLFTAGTDRSLDQLPADIALNGHISSEFGCPLYNIHRTDTFYYADINPGISSFLRGQSKAAFANCSWLRKKDLPDTTEEDLKYDPTNSAFALRPKNPLKIEFRPLKMETYAMFNGILSDEALVANKYGRNVDALEDKEGYKTSTGTIPLDALAVPDRYIPENADFESSFYRAGQPGKWKEFGQPERRASWSAVMARQNISYANPVPIGRIIDREAAQSASLLWDAENQVLPFMAGEYRDPGNFRAFPFDDKYHAKLYWDDGETFVDEFVWQRDNGNQLNYRNEKMPGSNAVGVVSACTTVAATNRISFSTDNYFGMEAYRSVRSSSGKYRNYPSWGTSTNNYRASNTYHLAATIYVGHPKDQTIFDAAKFAVHHYNERPDYEGFYIGDRSEWANNYQEPEGALVDEWPFMATVEINDTQLRYAVDITNIGIREPSYFPQGADQLAIPAAVGDTMFADFGVNENNEENKIVPDQYSWLNITRIGKLLPYKHKYYSTNLPELELNELPGTPGVKGFDIISTSPFFPVTQIGYVEDLPNEGVKARDLGFKAMIGKDGFGKNYKPGDIVGDPISGLQFKVAVVGAEGQVVRLHCFSAETGDPITPDQFDISPSRLLPIDAIVGPEDSGFGVDITTIQTEDGEGFSMSFFFGEVNENYRIDQKPEFVERELQISANADNSSSTDSDEPFGFVSEDITTPVDVSLAADQNGTFDIFFQAHNYTQFTFLSSQLNYYALGDQNPTPSDEQYIQLVISPE